MSELLRNHRSNDNSTENLYDLLLCRVEPMIKQHPFKKLNSKEQICSLLPHFLGLSIAFPYIQAGSQLNLIHKAIDENRDVSQDVELTSVVGNFLCWDETGGAYVLEKYGKAGLPKILQTHKRFHSNLLRDDIKKLTSKSVAPDFSEPTRSYLNSLKLGLSDFNPVIRCAYMVAFEIHAFAIIESLMEAICNNFEASPNELIYFTLHVGGDDAAEIYHLSMVQEMISLLIPNDKQEIFLSTAINALTENLDWAEKIGNIYLENGKKNTLPLAGRDL